MVDNELVGEVREVTRENECVQSETSPKLVFVAVKRDFMKYLPSYLQNIKGSVKIGQD
jgi:hypothetical protein